jgi:hypothetical protein
MVDQILKMTDANGVKYTVPSTSYKQALEAGWHLDTPKEMLKEQQIKDEAQNIKTEAQSQGALGAFGSNFYNQGLMGVPEIINEHTQTNVEKEGMKQAEKEHPIATYGGAGAGFLTSLLYGAGEAKALGLGAEGLVRGGEKLAIKGAEEGITHAAAPVTVDALKNMAVKASLKDAADTTAKKILGAGVNYAAQGAAFTAPKAIAQAAYGDPDQAAETLLWGAGTGFVLGAGGKSIGIGAKAGIGALGKGAPAVADWADEILAKQAGLNKGSANKLGTDKVDRILSVLEKEGLTGEKVSKEAIENLADQTGQKLGEHSEFLDKAIQNDPELQALKPNHINIADTIEKQISDKVPGLDTPINRAPKAALNDILETVRNWDNSTLKDTNELKRAVGQAAKWNLTDTDSTNAIRKTAYGILRGEEEKSIGSIYAKVPGAEDKLADYLAQKTKYGALQDLLSVTKDFTEPLGQIGGGAGSGMGRTVRQLAGLHIGGLPGLAAEAVIDPFISKLWNNSVLPSAAKYIRKVASNPETQEFLGSIIAKNGQEMLQKHLDMIPEVLATGSKQTALLGITRIDPYKQFLGDKANGLSKDQQYEKVTQTLKNTQADPQGTIEKIGQLNHIFGGDPKLASIVMQKNYAAINYLTAQVPKDPNPPQPFQLSGWKPTQQQKQDFAEKLEVVNNPMIAIHDAANGSLSKNQVDAVKAVYPAIYNSIIQKITETAYGPQAPQVSYRTKTNLSKLIGIPLDPSLNNIGKTQMIYSQKPQNNDKPPQKREKTKEIKLNKMPKYETNAQRIENK